MPRIRPTAIDALHGSLGNELLARRPTARADSLAGYSDETPAARRALLGALIRSPLDEPHP
jgi:hypothetical protein